MESTPNFNKHLELINDWKNSVKKFDLMEIRVVNPKYGLKNESNFIKLKEYYSFMLYKSDNDLNTNEDFRNLLRIIVDMNTYNHLETEKLTDYWRKVSEIITEIMQYTVRLIKINNELNKQNKTINEEKNILQGRVLELKENKKINKLQGGVKAVEKDDDEDDDEPQEDED